MSWLIPLGFIGLSGLAVLLLIYLIRPNYQNKYISTTFVWKLSLQYKKRKTPISKLKNLLILLLQILILLFCVFIMARPVIAEPETSINDYIVIIDASASMRAIDDGNQTRFERAVDEARGIASSAFSSDCKVSFILAGEQAEFLSFRAQRDQQAEVTATLDALLSGETRCTFGEGDIDGAVKLANGITEDQPKCKVILLTGKQYGNSGYVEVRDMSRTDGSEWNVAVLDCRAVLNENNYYVIYVDLACYGRDVDVAFTVSVSGANGNSSFTYSISSDPNTHAPIRLTGGRTTTVEIPTETVAPDNERVTMPIYSLRSVTAFVQISDSIAEDNSFTLYGTAKETLKIQYASNTPNSMFAASLSALKNALAANWNVDVTEVRNGNVPQTSGFDMYVFEEFGMETLPTDGVVLLVNPVYAPRSLGFGLASTETASSSDGVALTAGTVHPITNKVDASKIFVTRYKPIVIEDDVGFESLMYCNGRPVLIAKNTADSKVTVMSFSVNYSTVTMETSFSLLVLAFAQYYMPYTFDSNVYNVNETVTLKARGPDLKIDGAGESITFNTFPAEFAAKRVGTYTLTQTLISGKEVTEWFFVRIPAAESNIVRVIDVLDNLGELKKAERNIEDLCVYFAAVLICLLVAERLLHMRSIG